MAIDKVAFELAFLVQTELTVGVSATMYSELTVVAQILVLRMVSLLRHLWRFSRGCLLFGKQVFLGFLKCSGKLCSSPAVVVELALCEF